MIEFHRPSPSNAQYVLQALREEEEKNKQNARQIKSLSSRK